MTDRPSTILVIDDVPTNIRVLRAILDGAGYDVLSAESGMEALEIVDGAEVDLVLLDINMPGMNGLEVCRRLRERDPMRMLPIVMVTASADENTVTAIDAGADDFIVRPFDQDELLARLRSLVRIKQLHDTVEAQSAELRGLTESLQERVDEQLGELERLRQLRRFLSPQLADVVSSAGDEDLLEPHRREIAVVFCDLRGYTRFAAGAEPEELVQALRSFHDVLGRLVGLHDATVGHFDGDGVMLFFNDPVPCPDPALRAVRFALDLRDDVVALHDDWRRRGHDLDIGFGIAFGFATLGTIGFEGRYDYSALGPVVNKAARLCTAALPGEILVDQRAFGEVEPHVDAETRDPIDAKGFPEPVPAWSVTALQSSAATSAAASHRTEIRLLGPVEVLVDGQVLDFSTKERALVAILAASANQVVTTDSLTDDLWDGRPPESASTSLRVHVSRVRKALSAAGADALIVTRAPGYVLDVAPELLDRHRFESLVEEARTVEAAEAAAVLLRDALELWRGPALDDVASAPRVGAEAARLEELRLAVIERRIDADLDAGMSGELVAELRSLVQAHPLRERLWSQLMLALYRSGRQSEALRAYQELRDVLIDEVGVEPSPEVAQLEASILAQDESLHVFDRA